jgi:hypothetical protein
LKFFLAEMNFQNPLLLSSPPPPVQNDSETKEEEPPMKKQRISSDTNSSSAPSHSNIKEDSPIKKQHQNHPNNQLQELNDRLQSFYDSLPSKTALLIFNQKDLKEMKKLIARKIRYKWLNIYSSSYFDLQTFFIDTNGIMLQYRPLLLNSKPVLQLLLLASIPTNQIVILAILKTTTVIKSRNDREFRLS